MNDVRAMLVDTATRIFQDRCKLETISAAEEGVWPAELWQALEETGLTLAGVPEDSGGSGGSLGDSLAIMQAAGRFAAPVPLAETALAAWLLSSAGLAVPTGPLTVAPVLPGDELELRRDGAGWTLFGSAARVPWARAAERIAVLARSADGPMVASVAASACPLAPGVNVAGEPRDAVAFDGVTVATAEAALAPAGLDSQALRARGALTRVLLGAGALEQALELTVTYATDRTQFGRPISRFQVIQQQLAVFAAEVAATSAAAAAAAEAAEHGDALLEIAAAKIRFGEAASTTGAIAHQVHGAIGFTQEHALHLTTRRLWAWRDEFGGEAEWAALLGERLAAGGPEALWSFITGD
ncbi:MAG: acyl-CoA/acyl-ACP dehydrogenase [Chloroflexi bacterium]|nr:acyl-CoA/acyl-ACP dehydrogenase [Chloroflexota bacterium]